MLDTVRKKLQDGLSGFKTFLAAGAVAVIGIADAAGGVDITPLLKRWFTDGEIVGVIMASLGIIFGVLRYVTTTPPFKSAAAPEVTAPESDAQLAPVNKGVDAGD